MPTYTARRGWQRVLQARIPTLFGLGILVLGVVAGIVVLGQGTLGFLPRASADAVPQDIRITNITDTGFTVSFLTEAPAPGYLEYGTSASQTKVQVRDDRDQLANSVGSFTSHHITVKGLVPVTQYYFRLGTGSGAAFDNNGQPFTVRTARAVAPSSEARTAYGNVNTEVGNPADGALVYITIQGASPLSAQVKSNGSWAMPLASVRSLDLSSQVTIDDSTPVKIEVQGVRRGDTLLLNTTVGQTMPLQSLQFGQPATTGTGDAAGSTATTANTDTSTQTQPDTTGATGGADGTANNFGSLYSGLEGSQTATSEAVKIRLQEDEILNTTKPEFQGSAPPGGYVQIELHSETPYYGAVATKADGSWNWSPPADLEPGEHTITVTFVDEKGETQRVQRNFIVQAGAASTPAFTSSSSAVVPTPTPTPTLVAQAPTPIPTLPPTSPATRSAATVASVSAQPVSGSVGSTIMLAMIALACFVVGGSVTAWSWWQPASEQE